MQSFRLENNNNSADHLKLEMAIRQQAAVQQMHRQHPLMSGPPSPPFMHHQVIFLLLFSPGQNFATNFAN
jgi:hypothetical protein